MSTTLFIEFKESSVHLLDGEHASEFSLAREPSGRISTASVDALRRALAPFGGRKAICAIPARGVSLRTMSVPAGSPEEIARILPLQIEAQFPVPPSELAWGYAANPQASAPAGLKPLLIAAVKRDILEDYRVLLAGAHIEAIFTIAALARATLARHAPAAFGFLEAERPRSELLLFDGTGQAQLRALDSADLRTTSFGQKLFITGRFGAEIARDLALNGAAEIIPAGPGTAANVALRIRGAPLQLEVASETVEPRRVSSSLKWPILAALLLLAFFALRMLEPALRKPRLENRLREIQASRDALPAIERDLGLLQYLRTNSPPYLDAIGALAESAPRGTRFESISIARRGDLSVRGSLQNPQGLTEFRNKLIASGLFARLVLDEQTPKPQGQQVTFRLSAQLHSGGAQKPTLKQEPSSNAKPE